MISKIIGYSHKQNPLQVNLINPDAPKRLWVIAGVHGDEFEGLHLADYWLKELLSKEFSSFWKWGDRLGLAVLSNANPDGSQSKRRSNHHNVDLNRNLPTLDWQEDFENVRYYPGQAPASEPETKAMLHFYHSWNPQLILSLHSFINCMININGPALEWGQMLAPICRLEAKNDIGYPTPGSLGTYVGQERHTALITYEILRDQGLQDIILQHSDTLKTSLEFLNQKEF